MKKLFFVFAVMFLAILILIADAALIEPNLLISRTQKLYLPHWNEELNGLKICIVSDMHIGNKFVGIQKVKELVKKANAEKPDLILLLGDFDALSITNSGISIEELAPILKDFKAEYGVYAIMGNHDYEPQGVVRKLLKKSEIPLLENQSLYLNLSGRRLKITGFKDIWHYKLNPQKIIGTTPSNVPIIVMSHNPDSFVEIPERVSLTLSGHTHGGEIILPFAGSFTIPSKYGQRFRKGYIVENNKHFYVTGGVASTSRLRFCNPPEIVFLNLYKQTSETKISDTKPIKGVSRNFIPHYISFFKKIKSGN